MMIGDAAIRIRMRERRKPMTTLSGFGLLAAIPEEKITDKITRRVLAGQKGMMVWWRIGAGTHVAAHSHPHEQLVWIIRGRLEFRIDTERRVLEPGGIAVIPSGVEHEGWCHEDTEVVDIFAPPREDFLAGGGPTWLREKS
jgi:unsaturated pyranuronate lyase